MRGGGTCSGRGSNNGVTYRQRADLHWRPSNGSCREQAGVSEGTNRKVPAWAPVSPPPPPAAKQSVHSSLGLSQSQQLLNPALAIADVERQLASAQEQMQQALIGITSKENEKFDLIFSILIELQKRQGRLEESVRSLKARLPQAGGSGTRQMADGGASMNSYSMNGGYMMQMGDMPMGQQGYFNAGPGMMLVSGPLPCGAMGDEFAVNGPVGMQFPGQGPNAFHGQQWNSPGPSGKGHTPQEGCNVLGSQRNLQTPDGAESTEGVGDADCISDDLTEDRGWSPGAAALSTSASSQASPEASGKLPVDEMDCTSGRTKNDANFTVAKEDTSARFEEE